ncbi:MAG: hypothetical protein UY83_C0002G0111 [Candidatus Adlerbacteria bacterium GW2011_GWA1_54_10]|uniref:Uncharacterized protein n=2 Tax=Candidatus Adleribacteriota TaxID=1752736 RepID=A0A0G2ASZ7_9BACT|nr:MAG: hypothetical protein UY83_C0002G0111 [Candidatus Adlerbacteria bacterium GW2011_GWA1_54_10]KKW37906.1 MAG: hypothetical protein UY86_C0002G0003 [Candidatus Adlerbacteria bacterium GW2011_GWB1_54_7]
MESMKEKFDTNFPEAKMLREMELKRTSRNLYNQSSFGKATSVIYLIVAIASIFVYWKFFEVNIFLSILYGLITWFVITYIFDKIFIKIFGVEKAVRKANDEEIESAGKQLEQTLKEKGKLMDDFLK